MADNPFEQLRSHIDEQQARHAEEAHLQEAERLESELLERREERVHRIGVLLAELKALMVVADAHENLQLVGGKHNLKSLEFSDNPNIARSAKEASRFIPHAEATEKALTAEGEYEEDSSTLASWKERVEEVVRALSKETAELRETSDHKVIQEFINEKEEDIASTIESIRKHLRTIFAVQQTPDERAAGTFLAEALVHDTLRADFPTHSEAPLEEVFELAPELKQARLKSLDADMYHLELATQSKTYVPYPIHTPGLSNALSKVYDTVRTYGETILTEPNADILHGPLEQPDPNFQDAVQHYAKVKQFEDLQTAKNNLADFVGSNQGYIGESSLRATSESYPQLTAAMANMYILQRRDGATFLPTFGLKDEVTLLSSHHNRGEDEAKAFLHTFADRLSPELREKLETVDQQYREESQSKIDNDIENSERIIEQITKGSEKLEILEQKLTDVTNAIERAREDLTESERNQLEHSYTQPGLFNKGKLAREQESMHAEIAQRKADLAEKEQQKADLEEQIRVARRELDIPAGISKEEILDRHTRNIEKLKAIHYL